MCPWAPCPANLNLSECRQITEHSRVPVSLSVKWGCTSLYFAELLREVGVESWKERV